MLALATAPAAALARDADKPAGAPIAWKTTYSGSYNFGYSASETGGTGTDNSDYRWSDTVEDVITPSRSGSFHEALEQQTMASGSRSIARSGALGSLDVACKIQSSPGTERVWQRTGPSTLVPELGDKLPLQADWGVPEPNPGLPNEGSAWTTLPSPGGGSEGPGAVDNGTVTVTGTQGCLSAPSDFLGYTPNGCAACIFGGSTGLEANTPPSTDFLNAWGGIGSPYGQENLHLGDVIKKPFEKSFAVSWDKSASGGGVTESGHLSFSSKFSFSVCKDQKPNVFLYSARGSSETRSDDDPNGLGAPALALYKVLKPRAAKAGADLFADGDPYPAIDINDSFRLDAEQHLLPTTHYLTSVAEGVKDGVKGLEHITSQQDATGRCWGLVLSGYSQGAEVVRRVIAKLPEDVLSHVAAVELFGDPYFSAGEANVMPFGDRSADATGVRLYFWQHGGIGPAPPPLPIPTYSWCNAHDLVCGFNDSFERFLLKSSTLKKEEDGHYTYGGDACMAADQVSEALKGFGADLASGSC